MWPWRSLVPITAIVTGRAAAGAASRGGPPPPTGPLVSGPEPPPPEQATSRATTNGSARMDAHRNSVGDGDGACAAAPRTQSQSATEMLRAPIVATQSESSPTPSVRCVALATVSPQLG